MEKTSCKTSFFFRMRSLRYLSVSKLLRQIIRTEDFLEFGMELEDLKIFGSTITRIETSAFQHVRSIKTLDLSENNIEFIDPYAFAEVSEFRIKLTPQNIIIPITVNCHALQNCIN